MYICVRACVLLQHAFFNEYPPCFVLKGFKVDDLKDKKKKEGPQSLKGDWREK